jgi:signal transduction histidine kinase
MVQTIADRFGSAMAAWGQRSRDWVVSASRTVSQHAEPDAISAAVPGLSLSAKFAFAAAVVLCNGMALLGGWVVTEIEKGMLQTFAAEESAYVQSLLEPIVPKLVGNGWTSAEASAAGDQVLKSTVLGTRLTSLAVWRPDGSVIYSTDKDLIGRKFPLTPEIQLALLGEVRTNLWDKRLFGVYRQKPNDVPIRTIYAPLRDRATGAVLAVVEIADNAEPSKAQLDGIRKRTWMVVGVSTLLMIALLFSIVHNGSRTIDQQRAELQHRYEDQTALARVNKDLSERLQESNRHGIELGEQLLRRIGMGLQDGPVQLLSLALLRMNELKDLGDAAKPNPSKSSGAVPAVEVIERATREALKEIRAIEAGLVLPELRRRSPAETLEAAIRAHERLTGTTVETDFEALPSQIPLPVAITLFRLAEEGLSNAFRHAGGRGQKVRALAGGSRLTVVVSDEGPGIPAEVLGAPARTLGLRGLRQRVESIGGSFEINSVQGKGTELRASIPYAAASPGAGQQM